MFAADFTGQAKCHLDHFSQPEKRSLPRDSTKYPNREDDHRLAYSIAQFNFIKMSESAKGPGTASSIRKFG